MLLPDEGGKNGGRWGVVGYIERTPEFSSAKGHAHAIRVCRR